MEKLDMEDLPQLEAASLETETEPSGPTAEAVGEGEKVYRNEISSDEQNSFLRDVLGASGAAEVAQRGLMDRASNFKHPDYEQREPAANNKPLHPSVTEQYFTEGGKEVAARHDPLGSFWHAEFVGGGQLPSELSGRFTDEKSTRHAIKIYLAKQESKQAE